MARNGVITLLNLVVREITHGESRSRLVLRSQNGNFNIVIESTAQLPSDMHVRPADTVDIKLDFDK